MTEDEMVGRDHWLDGHEFEQAPGVGDEAWCAAVHGVTKSRTWLSNWTELKKSCKKNCLRDNRRLSQSPPLFLINAVQLASEPHFLHLSPSCKNLNSWSSLWILWVEDTAWTRKAMPLVPWTTHSSRWRLTTPQTEKKKKKKNQSKCSAPN